MQNGRSTETNGVCVIMIYLACTMCGYSIDIMTESEAENPIRAKRIKYLTTRGQVCPNCLNTINKCEKIEASEEEIPVLRIEVDEKEKEKFAEFCRNEGYSVGTEYALQEFRKVKA